MPWSASVTCGRCSHPGTRMNAPRTVSGSFSLASRGVDIARLLGGTSLGALFSRYTASSVVALATSEVALVLLFGTGLVGAGPAAVIAFFCGAIPNYVLNRSWVWKRRGSPRVGREFVPYVLVSLATLLLAALATTFAARIAPGGETAQTVFRRDRVPGRERRLVRGEVRDLPPVPVRRRRSGAGQPHPRRTDHDAVPRFE